MLLFKDFLSQRLQRSLPGKEAQNLMSPYPNGTDPSQLTQEIPAVDINDALRTIICNSKIRIKPYNIICKNGVFEIFGSNC